MRAASSIALNIAGGSGRTKTDDRKRCYGIAGSSAMKCPAIADLLAHLDPSLQDKTESAKKLALNSVHSFQSDPQITTRRNLLGLLLLLLLLQFFRAWAGTAAGQGEMFVGDITPS